MGNVGPHRLNPGPEEQAGNRVAAQACPDSSEELGHIQLDGKQHTVRVNGAEPPVQSHEMLGHQKIPNDEKSYAALGAGLPVSKTGIRPTKISLTEVGKPVDRTWWKRGLMANYAMGLGGIAAAGCLSNPIGWIVGGCAIGVLVLGSLAYGGKVYWDHKAASRRAQQVHGAMQCLEQKMDIKLSRDEADRLRRLSSKDWEELLDVSDLKTGDDYARRTGNEPKLDWRTYIRALAIHDVATNEEVTGKFVYTEAARREDAKTLIAGAKRFKAGLIEMAKDPSLSEEHQFPKALQFALDNGDSEDSALVAVGQAPLQSDVKGPMQGKVSQVAGPDSAKTENQPASKEYQQAFDAFYELFCRMAGPPGVTDSALTGVKDKSEIDSINANLTHALDGKKVYSAMKQGAVLGKNDLSQRQRAEDSTVSALAAGNPKRFADLFQIEKAGLSGTSGKTRDGLYQAVHGILYAMAAGGATFEELEDAKVALTAVVEGTSEPEEEKHLLRKMRDALKTAADGTPAGRATGVHLDIGLERGRMGWNSLNYKAVQQAERLQSGAEAAKTASQLHPDHLQDLTSAGLSSDSATHVLHWAGRALEAVHPLLGTFKVRERIEQVLRLEDYAAISARCGHPYIPGDDQGLRDQRKDKIRAILYVVGADKPRRKNDAKGNDPLQTLARRLCECSEERLDDFLSLVSRADQRPQRLYESVQVALTKKHRAWNDDRAESLSHWLPAWRMTSQTDLLTAMAYGDSDWSGIDNQRDGLTRES